MRSIPISSDTASRINKTIMLSTQVGFALFQPRLLVRRLIRRGIAFIQFPLAFLFLFLFLFFLLVQIFLTFFVLIIRLGQGSSFEQRVMSERLTLVIPIGFDAESDRYGPLIVVGKTMTSRDRQINSCRTGNMASDTTPFLNPCCDSAPPAHRAAPSNSS